MHRLFAALVALVVVLGGCSHDADGITAPRTSKEPAGYALIASTDFAFLPWDSTVAGRSSGFLKPLRLESIVSGSELPSGLSALGAHALRHIIEAGTLAGSEEIDGDYAGFNMWKLGMPTGANGGPSDAEYSAFYQSTYFSIYGNGTTIETPPQGIKSLGYWGVTNNNQNGFGPGPTEIYALFVPVSFAGTALSPTTSQFTIDMITQNGSNVLFSQNLNPSKVVVVGQVHRFEQVLTLGTAGNADGTWDWWLDGVQIGHYTNVPFISPAFAANGGNGLSGFWGWQFSPVWGGSGITLKSRDDTIYLGATYISGIFLRNRL